MTAQEAQIAFRTASDAVIDRLLEANPVAATRLGDHRADSLLPDLTESAVDDRVRRLDDDLTLLDGLDDVGLPLDSQVDLEMLRSRVAAESFEWGELRPHRWNPLLWDPASAIHSLVVRDFAPRSERAASAMARLVQLPTYLDEARRTLREMPGLHVETALRRLSGFDAVVGEAYALWDGDADPSFQEAVDGARDAISRHGDWLQARQEESRRDSRLGVRLYSAALWHNLDEEITPVQVLERAEEHLDAVTTRMRECAAEYMRDSVRSPDVVRRALARIAAEAAVTDATVLEVMRSALDRTTEFVKRRQLVSMPDLPVQVIEMPEFRRGIAIAYCDAPGPFEDARHAAYVAVAPPPGTWSAERRESFYREYNGVLIHDLMAHEAMPGHVLQLAHARAVDSPSRVRRFLQSGVFVEGWAVYAEGLMAESGYLPDDRPDAAARFALQHLKMQARMTLNAILDARVHGGDIDEGEAVQLLQRRGFQEEGEAVGKWRRALLTATQLPTYFVGWQAVRSIVDDVRVLHPEWTDSQVHDLVLSQGSVGPRHLRALLGI